MILQEISDIPEPGNLAFDFDFDFSFGSGFGLGMALDLCRGFRFDIVLGFFRFGFKAPRGSRLQQPDNQNTGEWWVYFLRAALTKEKQTAV